MKARARAVRARVSEAHQAKLRAKFAAAGDRLGMDVLKRSFYSPIPTVPDDSDPIWRARTTSLDPLLRADDQLDLLQRLQPYLDEFDDALSDSPGFKPWNGLYQAGDAETLYALIRSERPRRVLELGSGYSTFVVAAACERNRASGYPVEAVAIDPEPRVSVEGARSTLRNVVTAGLSPSNASTRLTLAMSSSSTRHMR